MIEYEKQLEEQNEEYKSRCAKLETENSLFSKILLDLLEKCDSVSIEKTWSPTGHDKRCLVVKMDSVTSMIEINDLDLNTIQKILHDIISKKIKYQEEIQQNLGSILKNLT